MPKNISAADLIAYVRQLKADKEKALAVRLDAEKCWAEGPDKPWEALLCYMTKAQRLNAAAVHGRIAKKCRRELELLNALLVILGDNVVSAGDPIVPQSGPDHFSPIPKSSPSQAMLPNCQLRNILSLTAKSSPSQADPQKQLRLRGPLQIPPA